MKNKASWPMSDFGNITIPELDQKGYEWFLSRAKNKNDVPESVLNRLRKLYPALSNIETNNKLNINLKFTINLISKLRHIIVHKGGVVDDKSLFLQNTLKKSGLWNNGNFKDEYKQFVNMFFGSDKYKNTILLLEIRIESETPFDLYHNIYENLSGYLMSYAVLVHKSISADL